MFSPSLNKLWLQCIPLPLIPKNGFGMNVALNPKLLTTAFTASLNVYCPNLSSLSISNIVDHLVDLTNSTAKTLTIYRPVFCNMSEELLETISSKNWTLSVIDETK